MNRFIVRELETIGFRNLIEQKVAFNPGLNVLAGPNAAGKTSVLEALVMLADGQSFRTRSVRETVKWRSGFGRLRALVDQDGVEAELEVRIKEGVRQFLRNGTRIRSIMDYLGGLPYVLFTAEHLAIAQGPPEHRRAFIDRALLQMYPRYLDLYRGYRKVLEQRNRLLRVHPVPEDELAAWTDSLTDLGSRLRYRRCRYVRRLAPLVHDIHHGMSPGEDVEVRYGRYEDGMDEEAFKAAMQRGLQATAGAERQRFITLIGPHRDDLHILLNGRKIRDYGSRGQQRSMVVSLKMAELELFKQVTGACPILLLDDITAELDEHRCKDLMKYLKTTTQSFISTTDYGKISDLLETAAVFRLSGGAMSLEES
ncbi:DNA replication/repair protein RecF [bacterium]|nr:DNA replication/repair protein RecF [candidate division CSSED10-310 bacterium]